VWHTVTELTDGQLSRLFETFEHTAFRLEVRESYAGVDDVAFREFRSGRRPSLAAYQPWMENIRAQTASGKRVERVRVVSQPWSDYTRFGLWACRSTVDAGEDIRYLERGRAGALGLPGHDYWLFDSRMVVIIRFDDASDAIIQWEQITDPAAVVEHNYWRDAAWHHATPRDEYLEQAGQGAVEPPAGP
jgi:hypothetical protein